jgi:hypothetical protein
MTYLCLRSLGRIYHCLLPAKALAYPLSLFLFLTRLLRPLPGYPLLLRPCALFLAPPLSESPLVAISSLAIPHLLLGLPSPLSSSLQLMCFARHTGLFSTMTQTSHGNLMSADHEHNGSNVHIHV